LFKKVEIAFNEHGMCKEMPNSRLVEVWDTEGEMDIVDKDLIYPALDNYTVQFWKGALVLTSLSVYPCEGLNYAYIELDGTSPEVYLDLFKIMQTALLSDQAGVGFVMDRREITEGCDWDAFFNSDRTDVDIITGKTWLTAGKTTVLDHKETLEITSIIPDVDMEKAYIVFLGKGKQLEVHEYICTVD
jgi:hypothetical protein